MKITLGFDTKSIEKARKQIEAMIADLTSNRIITDLLNGCADWFIAEANSNLARTDIGENVKLGIMESWTTQQIGNVITITNTHEKAVYVEFGVGVKGEENQHENAKKAGYEYNVDSPAKDDNGTWHFYTNIENLDLPKSALVDSSHIYKPETRKDGSVYRQRVYVETRGTESTMYAYNALIDLKDIGIYEVWEQIKKKYWS